MAGPHSSDGRGGRIEAPGWARPLRRRSDPVPCPDSDVELEGREGRRGAEGNVALEVVLLVPVMVLLALLVLWAGRGGRTELAADLAAEEAAVAASLCCLEDDPALPENAAGREAVVEDVLAARPGLDFLCIGGPQPTAGDDGDEGFVSESWLPFPGPGDTGGVGILGVHFSCETDGGVAPLKSTFPTVVFEGQAAEVVVLPSLPVATIDDVIVEEGQHALVTVRLDSTATDVVTLNYSTAYPPPLTPDELVAEPGLDYTRRTDAAVSIPVGQWEAVVSIPTRDDDLYERDEVFTVVFTVVPPLNGQAAAALEDDTVEVTIGNDDDAPEMSFELESVSRPEGENLDFVVKLDEASGLPATALVSFIDSEVPFEGATATEGSDFVVPPLTSVTVDPGDTESRPIVVRTIQDSLGEGDETFFVRLHNPQDASLRDGDNSVSELDAIGVIVDDEPELAIVDSCTDARFDRAHACVVEGGELDFILRLDEPLEYGDSDVTVVVETNDVVDEAVAGEDYEEVTETTLTFSAPTVPGGIGDQERIVSVQSLQDPFDEGDGEVFLFDLVDMSDNVHAADRLGRGVIIDDDLPPILTLSGPSGVVREGESLYFTLSLNNESGQSVLANYHTVDAGATAGTDCGEDGVDYVGIPMSVGARAEILPGTASTTIEVVSCADDLDEPDEGLVLAVTNPVNAEFTPAGTALIQEEGVITDDDEATLSVAPAYAAEGDDTVPGQVDFEVTLSPPSTSTVTVEYMTRERAAGGEADGEKAAVQADDYLAASGTLTFAPGDSTATVSVPIVHDTLDEFDEVFDFVLLNAANAPLAGGETELSVKGTIEDNDPLPRLYLAPVAANVQEGDDLVFEARLDAPSGRKVWFDHAVGQAAVNSATPVVDYEWSPSDDGTLGIEPGDTSLEIRLPTYSDGIFEGVEHMRLFLLLRGDTYSDRITYAFSSLADRRKTGTITDSGAPPQVSLTYPVDASGDPLPTPEGYDLVFTVNLTTPRSADTSVRFQTIPGGTATPGDDFSPVDRIVTVPAGQASLAVAVPTFEDNVQETPDVETVRAQIVDIPPELTVGATMAVGAILDSDVIITVGFAPPGSLFTVAEGETAEAVVALSRPVALDVYLRLFTYETLSVFAPAHSNDDFVPIDPQNAVTVVIPAGDMSTTVPVSTVQDDIDEHDERFALRLRPHPGGWPDWLRFDRPTVSVDILDDDPEPEWEAPDPADVVEDDGAEIVFTVSLTRPSQRGEIRLEYLVDSVQAQLGLDYEMLSPDAPAGNLSFPIGTTQQTVTLGVINDIIPEGAEDIRLRLEPAFGFGNLVDPPTDPGLRWAWARIIDDDVRVTLGGGARVEEGEPLVVEVQLDRPAPEPLTVQYFTSLIADPGLDPASADDFTAISADAPGEVSIPAGSTSATFEVPTTEDEVHEGDEHFRVLLVAPQPDNSLTVWQGVQTAKIVDDESPPEVSVVGPSSGVVEGHQAEFHVELSVQSDQQITVDYTTSDVSAAAGLDYIGVAQTAVFQPLETSLPVLVDTEDDGLPEEDEEFELVLSDAEPASAVTLGTARAGATIIDNDLGVGLEEDEVRSPEGGPLEFTVKLSRPAPETLTVEYHTHLVAGADAASPSDFRHVPQASLQRVQIAAGSDSGTIRVDTIEDEAHEPDERFQVVLPNQTDTRLVLTDRTALGLIVNDDDVPELSVIGPGRVGEAEQAEFKLMLDRESSRLITVDYATADGTASTPLDYAAQSGTATFSPGQTEFVVSVSIQDDLVPEGDETFNLVLSDAGPADLVTLGTARAEATIEDSDVSVRVSPSRALEDSGTLTFVAELSAAATVDVAVDYSTHGPIGGATPGEDYRAVSVPQTVTITAGSTSSPISVALIDDDIDEDHEIFQLRLSNPRLASPAQGVGVALANAVALGTIEDDDDPPTVSISSPSAPIEEGASMEFTVSITGRAEQQIVVGYGVVGGTAEAPADFTAVPVGAAITFPPGDTQDKAITVATIDDDITEEDETIEMGLTSITDAGTLGQSTAAGVIGENDTCIEAGEQTPQFTHDEAPQVAEDAGTATFTFTLIKAFCSDTRVSVRTVAGTAESGVDFIGVNRQLSLVAGQTAIDVPVAIEDDDLPELDERFAVQVNYDVETWAEASVAIIDDDGPDVSVSDSTGHEGDDLMFTVALSESTPKTVVVDYSTRDIPGGATGGSPGDPGADYEHKSGTLRFGPGETSKSLTVATFNDEVHDPHEVFELKMGNAGNSEMGDDTGLGSIVQSDCLMHTDADQPLITISVPPAIEVEEDVSGAAGLLPVTFSSRPCTGALSYRVVAVETGTAAGSPYQFFFPSHDFRLTDTVRSLLSTDTSNIKYEYPPSGIHNDIVPEYEDETFTLRVEWDDTGMPAHYHDIAPVYTVVTIVDDDTSTVSVANGASVEGFALPFEIKLTKAVDFDVSVSYKTKRDTSGHNPANGGEMAGQDQDYEPVTVKTTTIPAGDTSTTVFVESIWDNDKNVDYEPDETFLFELTSVTKLAMTDSVANGTILDPGECVTESQIRDHGLGVAVVPWFLSSTSSTTLGEDLPYNIPEGQDSVVGVNYKVKVCPRVSFTIYFTEASDSPASVFNGYYIGDYDHPGPQGFDAIGYYSREESIPDLDMVMQIQPFPISRGSDFGPGTFSVVETILPDDSYAANNDDRLYEKDENFNVVISYIFGDSIFTDLGLEWDRNIGYVLPFAQEFPVTIVDDDPPPRVTVSDASGVEGDTLRFRVSLSEVSGLDTVITYETRDHTSAGASAATAGADYSAASGTITIPAGQKRAIIRINTIDESVADGDKTLLLALTGAVDATLADAQAVGEIADDESCIAPTNPNDNPLELSIGSATVDEDAGTATVSVQYPRICRADDVVRFGTAATSTDTSPPAGETATPGVDYDAVDEVSIRTRGTTNESTFVITIHDDNVYERDETFTVWAEWGPGMPAAYRSLGRVTATTTIGDDEPAPTVRIEDAGAEYGERLMFDILVDSAQDVEVGLPVTVYWETRELTSSDAAVPGTHFTAVDAGVTTIPAGQSKGTARVDTLPVGTDDDRRLRVVITGVDNATVGDGHADGLIYKCVNPSSGYIQVATFDQVTLHESDGTVKVRFEIPKSFCGSARINYGFVIDDSDGANAAGSDDLSALRSRSVQESEGRWLITSFDGGESKSREFDIHVIDDDMREGDETFILRGRWGSTMPERYRNWEPVEFVVTIIDDD